MLTSWLQDEAVQQLSHTGALPTLGKWWNWSALRLEVKSSLTECMVRTRTSEHTFLKRIARIQLRVVMNCKLSRSVHPS